VVARRSYRRANACDAELKSMTCAPRWTAPGGDAVLAAVRAARKHRFRHLRAPARVLPRLAIGSDAPWHRGNIDVVTSTNGSGARRGANINAAITRSMAWTCVAAKRGGCGAQNIRGGATFRG